MRLLASRPAVVVVGALSAITLLATSGLAPASAAGASAPTLANAGVIARHTSAHHPVAKPGRWKVATSSPGAYRVTWTSPTRLPYADARPEIVVNGRWAGPSTLSADGRRVSVLVSSPARPTSADFDVVLGGKVLDARTPRNPTQVPYRRPAQLKALAEDPASPDRTPSRAATTRSIRSSCRASPSRRDGRPRRRAARPTPPTRRPLVLFLHGRHEPCYNPTPAHAAGIDVPDGAWPCKAPARSCRCRATSATTTSSGCSPPRATSTVSVRADGINAQDYRLPDGGAEARARRPQAPRQLGALVGDATSSRPRPRHPGRPQPRRRGRRPRVAQPPHRRRLPVAGQVLIGPTDFGFQTAPYVPTVTVLPYCDGDVSDLQGQNFTDDGRDLGLGRRFRRARSWSWAPTTTSSTPSGRPASRPRRRGTTGSATEDEDVRRSTTRTA